MPTHQKHFPPLRIQHGQAMIEYAILLILFSVVFIGGAELGKTTLASYKTTDAAKTAISEYAEINQQRLNILNAEKQYLTTLAGYGCSLMYEITNYGTNPNTGVPYTSDDLEADANNVTCLGRDRYEGYVYKSYQTLSTPPLPTFEQFFNVNITHSSIYDNYISYLDVTYDSDDNFIVPLESLLNEATALDDIYSAYNATANPDVVVSNFPSTMILSIDVDNDGIISDDEHETFRGNLEQNLLSIKDAAIPDVSDLEDSVAPFWGYGNGQYTKQEIVNKERRLRVRVLLIIEHIKLSKLPLNLVDEDGDGDVDTLLSDAKIKLGDHSAITEANCDGGVLHYGMPNSYPYHDSDGNGVFELNNTASKEVYLFHSQSINTKECTTEQIKTLINGKGTFVDADGDGEDDDGDFVPGLPKLNQAMYSLSTKVCVNAQDEYVSCNSSDVARTLLKPPGKICFENAGANADACPTQPDEVTGFYRWGKGSDDTVDETKFGYVVNDVNAELANGFRPTFQLDCGFQETFGSAVFDTNCNNNPSTVRVHTRYRSVFEGFLTFGLEELNNPAAVALFYNPNNVGVTGSNSLVGGHGSEIGPVGRNGRPTVKQHKDFRGCYEVDVETNQVSACN